MQRTCVIIINYRGAVDTAICLRSLAESGVPVKAVVVDSTPHDPELAALKVQYEGVEFLTAETNVGFGRANNIGIRWALEHTDCDFLFVLNNDASVQPDAVGLLERSMQQHPERAVLTPRIVYRHDPTKLWYGGGDVDWRRASVFTPGFNGAADAEEALRERDVTFASGCALFVRRTALILVGGFDPRYFMYEEDVEWCLRALRRGLTIHYLPSALVLHRAQGSSREGDQDLDDFWSVANPRLPFYAFHIIRNRLLNAYMYATFSEKLAVALFFPLYVVRRAIPFLAGGRFDALAAMWRGAVDAWKVRNTTAADELAC